MSELETARRQDAPNPPALDRRAQKRYPSDLSAVCRLLRSPQDSPTWHVRVLDISAGGVGLDSGHAWEPGTELEVQLRSSPRHLMRVLMARVVHARPLRGGGWRIGCAFDYTLTEGELQALL
ncbi:MAG TPA: PilZ domain-containing protein [Gemmataceae bacterium]|nr:PilZ domain-containing protein [Gemmataceae bacterium]